MTEHEKTIDQRIQKRNRIKRIMRNLLVVVLIFSLLTSSTVGMNSKTAEAIPCFCVGFLCFLPDVAVATVFYWVFYLLFTPLIERLITRHINNEENWIVERFFGKFFVRGLAEMTEYLSAVGMYQMQILGSLFDAKNQLETQRLFWRLHAQAHKDYHPSDDFCWIGTNARALAATEDRAKYNRNVMSKKALSRQLGQISTAAEGGVDSDKDMRWRQFVRTYCDVRDNNWSAAVTDGTGLELACDHDGAGPGTVKGADDLRRVNRDIDFSRLIDSPRTLQINFEDDATVAPSMDEEDVMAMSKNLYGHDVLSRDLDSSRLDGNDGAKNLYVALRSVAAKRNVAENTYNALVALKSSGTGNDGSTAPPQQVRQFMAAVVKELMPTGTPDTEIYDLIGRDPSYYAQLEVLAKKIYENPEFYANLYDTPTNVERKSVAMKGIEMMLDRALLESELRQEMLLSVLLSSELRDDFRNANSKLQGSDR